jgi:hypothetical protein
LATAKSGCRSLARHRCSLCSTIKQVSSASRQREKPPMASTGPEHFQDLLSLAEQEMWLDFERAERLHHAGTKGSSREASLAEFLRSQLPDRYAVETGEVIDTRGRRSGQIDLLVFDASTTKPLYRYQNKAILLPAEAALATVEVKTTLRSGELNRALGGISSVHSLRPWGVPWHGTRRRGDAADDNEPRVLTTIFGYQTDLTGDDWITREATRLHRQLVECKVPRTHLDLLVILDRGIIVPSRSSAVDLRDQKNVLGTWFFALINFLGREVRRRRAFPWDNYSVAAATWSSYAPLAQRVERATRQRPGRIGGARSSARSGTRS